MDGFATTSEYVRPCCLTAYVHRLVSLLFDNQIDTCQQCDAACSIIGLSSESVAMMKVLCQQIICTCVLQAFWTLGSCLEAGLAWLVLNSMGWRWLVALSSIPLGNT